MNNAAMPRAGLRRLIFLHIGKNAGTQIVFLTEQLIKEGVYVEKVSHDTKLKLIHKDAPYFFSIRDPIKRFSSAFYSRKRKGQPRLHAEWTRYEAYAFERFEHANDLAEALFRKDEAGRAATQAISSIRHTAMQQIDWFEGMLNFDIRPPLCIVRQECLEQDFEFLLKTLNLNIGLGQLKLATDDVNAHRNDYSQAPQLSELAISNLRSWYARDFAFYDLCLDWIDRNMAS